ncbi:hypothetical protein POM88_039333 [Heracleum sosnowskyi]|uniref:Cytochrome P450 n=1 Tax=Heracleum sosnowskyi TaxID=360622 RepID=A0AAD8H9T8_9APIA|nr:hypothetical protein POM88_039333 [Heracleum sosnowskyi]
MEQNTVLYASISLLLIILVSKLFKKSFHLPPSPFPKLPIIGHLHLIKPPLHRTLDTLSKTFGPIISLQFGSSLVVVVSSPAAVEECFTKNDVVLADRPRLTMGKYMGYNWSTMAGASYGDHWRNLRRKRYYGDVVDDQEEAKNVRKIIEEVLSISNSYPGDFLPFLKWIDYKNYQKRAATLSKKMDQILQGIIEEHRSGEGRNSMVDHLLSLQESQPDSHSDVIIKGLMAVRMLINPAVFCLIEVNCS